MAGTLFQISTAAALIEGVIHGEVSFKELKQQGDFGLGTLDQIDGELIILDGKFYQCCFDGTVREVDPNTKTPFAQLTFFKPSKNFVFSSKSLIECEKEIIAHIENPNKIHAIRIQGVFDHLKLRIPPMIDKGGLKEAAAIQKEFGLSKVLGTALGFLSPQYFTGISVTGLHLHFISKDKKVGGHVLDMEYKNIDIGIQPLDEYRIVLPDSQSFRSANLNQDYKDVLHHLEKSSSTKREK